MTNDERPEKLASPDCEELIAEQVTFANWVSWQLAKKWIESDRDCLSRIDNAGSQQLDALPEPV